MKPKRENGESLEQWIRRLEEWNVSPEGRAYEAARLAEFEARRGAEDRRWLEDAGVPGRVIDVLEAGVKDTPPLLAIRESVGEAVVVLAGALGTGKTVAACWDLAQPKVRTGLFVRASRLSRWDRYDSEEMDKLLDPKLLVIDDLGSEFLDAKGSFLATYEEVLVDRAENKRRTVITTNKTSEEFREAYGERTLERVRESGSFYEFGGKSLRGRA